MSVTFDATYYLQTYSDVLIAYNSGKLPGATAAEAALYHYQNYGWKELRNPSADFNTAYYLTNNADVTTSKINPLDHFVAYGAKEGRAPNSTLASVAATFNSTLYLSSNADVQAAITAGTVSTAYQHWVLYGASEGRAAYTTAGVLISGTTGSTSGSTFTLTTAIETLSGTNSASTVNGVIANGASNGQTYQTGDTIDTAKTLKITGSTNTAAIATVKNVETVDVTDLAGLTLDASLFSNVTNIVNSGTASMTVSNAQLATVYGVSSTGDLNVNAYRAADIAGTSDTAKFSVTGAGSNTGSVATGFTVDSSVLTSQTGVEAISVATSGTNIFTVVGSTTAVTDAKTLTITGSGANTITASGLTQATLFDMSTATGANTLSMGTALATGVTVKGGTGTSDTLRVQQASTAANLTVSGVETLRSSTGSSTGSLVFSTAPNFTAVRIDGDAAESGALTLTSVGTFANLNYVGAGSTALSGSQQQFNSLTVNSSFTGSSDTVAVAIGNQGTTLTTGIGYNANALTLNGVETLGITVSDVSASGVTAFTGISDTSLSSLTVTSAGSVTLGNVSGAPASGSGNIASINLSAVTGTGVSTMTILNNSIGPATTITAAKGGTTVTVGGAEAGTDSLIYIGNDGVDTVDARTNTFAGVVVADGKAGNDVLTGGSGADALTGGEGADIITGGIGVDTVILTETVSSVDRVRANEADGAVAAAGTFTSVDTVTGFNADADIFQVNGAATSVILNGGAAAQAADTAFTATASGAFDANGAVGGAFITGATAASLTTETDVTTAIGAVANETAAEEAYFVVVNTAGTQFGVYHYIEAAGAGDVGAGELELLGTVSYTGTLSAADITFF